ncbi:MAG: metallophosphoesterase [Bacteroidetes bacterium]|nr:metallophosphoesterase [Bacteroidota bacterium]
MKIQYASDLHIEFPENKAFLKANPLKPVGDILVLSGDIVPFAVMNKHDDFFSYVSDHFENTYWIPGNHEYYYSDLKNRTGAFHEKIKENVHLLNNTVIHHGEVDLIFSTLWSHIGMTNQWKIENSLSDFQVIKSEGNKLTTWQYNQIHEECTSFLKEALLTKINKSVVVSHHAPTFYNYPEKYKGDALNEAFAVELFDLIERMGPKYWIYGHTHINNKDFTIAGTHVITNQLGYVAYGEHNDFSNDMVVKI